MNLIPLPDFHSIRLHGLTAVVALMLAALGTAPGNAADYDLGPIHISQTWSRATPKGAASGAAYLTITNNGKEADRVGCVSSDASGQCEIHTMTMDDGVMKMRPVEGGLEIKPGETVTLKPGGLHIMLLGLKHPLEQGGTLKTTLKFDKAGTIDVEYPVAALGAQVPGGPMHGGNMMMDHGGGMMQMNPR
jgi:copper(I)-binding protein